MFYDVISQHRLTSKVYEKLLSGIRLRDALKDLLTFDVPNSSAVLIPLKLKSKWYSHNHNELSSCKPCI